MNSNRSEFPTTIEPFAMRPRKSARMTKKCEQDHSRSYTKPDARRSRNMRAVHSTNTKPERLVRSAAHSLGLRFSLHRKELPGRPDLVFPKEKVIIFVNGCFWHQHVGCAKATLPKTNRKFWKQKLARNAVRDREIIAELRLAGWRVGVIWECETKNPIKLTKRIERAILSKGASNRTSTKVQSIGSLERRSQASP
jgi:DNA mismatch endonuclease, patch repair protein